MWLFLACHSQDDPSTPGWELGETVVCDAPEPGIAPLEVGESLGLTGVSGDPEEPFGSGSVVIEDVDGDDDLDLVYMSWTDGPLLFLYEDGMFSNQGAIFPMLKDAPVSMVELTGDALPDMVATPGNNIFILANAGAPPWSVSKAAYVSSFPGSFLNIAFGDLDQDNDLDMVAPSVGNNPGEAGAPVPLFRNDDGNFVLWQWLPESQEPFSGQAALITDIDYDQDLDIYLANDLETISALWVNNGDSFTEEAESFGLKHDQAGMGFDSADLNGDHKLDYCFSNVGTMLCFFSSDDGVFYEGAKAIGLAPKDLVGTFGTIGWSVELVDLDNDGDVDAVQASGEQGLQEGQTREGPVYPDLLWENKNDFFQDITAEVGFGDTYNHVGMVAADFDRDGRLELVLGNPNMRPLLYKQGCSENSWINVDLRGPPGNRMGLGSRLEVTVGDRIWVRELYGLRGHGQGPSEFHVGLGYVDWVDKIRLVWPDGTEQVLTDIAPDRRILAIHPQAVD